ncbi:hypothetical protein R3X27_24950 [Tropicimonas sp. TH_r6]|uniref:hypothetical protein n=1 Tax=Tropicimonas sp. TH_r6 TaxID=3082085 RepID=UPI002952E0FE|nr:hypothetical protein [Tropicimonas sp. TH_r6]MDV7145938.1 hypothetical protein [Tropicimonas sp. TH_r6]
MADVQSWVFLFLGLFGGFAVSIAFWWLINHYFVPNLEFSVEVSRSKVGFYKSGVRHQIAIKNCGQRDAYNVKLRVRLKIKDILNNGGKLWDFMDLSVSDSEYFILRKGSMFRITPLSQTTSGFSRPMFPSEIREKYEQGVLTLDDLFSNYEEMRMFIEVIATDRFSGGAKYFRSKEYSKRDIRNGVFKGRNHLSIHRQSKPSSRS